MPLGAGVVWLASIIKLSNLYFSLDHSDIPRSVLASMLGRNLIPIQGDNDAFVDNPPSQFWWCSPTGTACSGYLDTFYQDAANYLSGHPGTVVVGALYKGFDDSNASWGGGRVIAEQCGQIFEDTANEVTVGGYWGSSNQMPYMQIATWNDYEEGTEVESGIDNCYTDLKLALNGSVLNWTLVTNGDTNATTKTIHHFALWVAPQGTSSYSLKKQVGPLSPASIFQRWDYSREIIQSI